MSEGLASHASALPVPEPGVGPAEALDVDPRPQWIQEVDARLAVNPHFVVGGNTHDLHFVPDADPQRLLLDPASALCPTLVAAWYKVILEWTVTRGVRTLHGDKSTSDAVLSGLDRQDCSATGLRDLMAAVSNWPETHRGRTALLISGA